MTANPKNMLQDDFLKLANHVRNLTGISLEASEKNLKLLETRIYKLNKLYGNLSLSEVNSFIDRNDRKFIKAFVSTVTTNTTHFFREIDHFKFLTTFVKDYCQFGRDEIRVWCAASSTGQEPYSLAMTIKEALADRYVHLKCLATDIDEKVLRSAISGVYPKADYKSIPTPYRRYFKPMEGDKLGSYVVIDDVKRSIKFRFINLLQTPYPFEHKFDIIFCRNVFIYFERDTVRAIIGEMARHLQVGGVFVVGHSEAISMLPKYLQKISTTVYQKVSEVKDYES